MNETELRGIIESVLKEMNSSNLSTSNFSKKEEKTVDNSTVEDTLIPDITKVDIKSQLLVKNPANAEGYLKMKSFTPARLGVGRTGTRYLTETTLRFRADHAAAQDAVFSDVSSECIEEMGFIPIQTICETKDEYLTRPDHGRVFSEETLKLVKEKAKANTKIRIIVGDGLSSAAIEANIKDILPAIKQGLQRYSLDFDEVFFIKYCRVSAMEPIGEVTGSDVVCLLIGERPGLVTAESMSAYIAYKPTVGMPEARRTVISNIHKGGTPAVEAGAYIADIMKQMLEKKVSGIEFRPE